MTGFLDTLPRRPVPQGIRSDVGRLASTVLGRDDLEDLTRADEVLSAARAEADRWKNGARAKYRAARRDGFEAGRRAAEEAGAANLIDLAAQEARLRSEYERRLDGLLLDAVRRFFGAAPWGDLMRYAATEAVAALPSEPRPILAAVQGDLDRIAAAADPLPVDLVADAGIPMGEVEIRSGARTLRISLERHLDHLARVLGDTARGDDD
ncbi:MAG: hypothetical protein AAF390_18090 [Pseudomonadota bacterium]